MANKENTNTKSEVVKAAIEAAAATPQALRDMLKDPHIKSVFNAVTVEKAVEKSSTKEYDKVAELTGKAPRVEASEPSVSPKTPGKK